MSQLKTVSRLIWGCIYTHSLGRIRTFPLNVISKIRMTYFYQFNSGSPSNLRDVMLCPKFGPVTCRADEVFEIPWMNKAFFFLNHNGYCFPKHGHLRISLSRFKFRPQLHHLVSHHAASCLQRCSLEALRTEQPFSRCCSSLTSNGALLCWNQIASLYLREDPTSVHRHQNSAPTGVWVNDIIIATVTPTVKRSASHTKLSDGARLKI